MREVSYFASLCFITQTINKHKLKQDLLFLLNSTLLLPFYISLEEKLFEGLSCFFL